MLGLNIELDALITNLSRFKKSPVNFPQPHKVHCSYSFPATLFVSHHPPRPRATTAATPRCGAISRGASTRRKDTGSMGDFSFRQGDVRRGNYVKSEFGFNLCWVSFGVLSYRELLWCWKLGFVVCNSSFARDWSCRLELVESFIKVVALVLRLGAWCQGLGLEFVRGNWGRGYLGGSDIVIGDEMRRSISGELIGGTGFSKLLSSSQRWLECDWVFSRFGTVNSSFSAFTRASKRNVDDEVLLKFGVSMLLRFSGLSGGGFGRSSAVFRPWVCWFWGLECVAQVEVNEL
ncbi:hypothetical protein Droror1_Dr00021626, partial [Drosera rotundifolia]